MHVSMRSMIYMERRPGRALPVLPQRQLELPKYSSIPRARDFTRSQWKTGDEKKLPTHTE